MGWRKAAGLLLAPAFALALLLTPLAAHADFAAGVRAYEAGDYRAALEAWQPLAERGDVAAMRNIGHLYRWGQGVDKDIQQAMHWYRKAAEMGFSRAQANLAAIYLQGDEGVPVDYAEAYKWFAAAAIQGLAVAQYNLGLMYELGLGVEKSDSRALGWYNLAAKTGQPEALERLSQLVKNTEAPLVSGVNIPAPQAAPADSKTENVGATQDVPPAAPVAAASEPQPVPQPAAPAASPASEPVAPSEPENSRPGLLSRFYSAISSGGGVSIPDMFGASPESESDGPKNGSDSKDRDHQP